MIKFDETEVVAGLNLVEGKQMNDRWRSRIFQTTFWLVTEVLLNLTGLDNLADYSEFVFEKHLDRWSCQPMMTRSLLHHSYDYSFWVS